MTSETPINFSESAFDHSKPSLEESLGVDLDEVDRLYSEKVLPIIDTMERFKTPAGTPISVIVEAILKADIPQKVRVFMLVNLRQAAVNY